MVDKIDQLLQELNPDLSAVSIINTYVARCRFQNKELEREIIIVSCVVLSTSSQVNNTCNSC